MKLGFTDGDNTMGIGTRPLEGAFFQAAIIKPKAISIPKQNFEFIPAPIAENKLGLTKRVHLKLLRDNERETVDGLAHVGHARNQKNLTRGCDCNASTQCFI
jgi:hypothetical protein